jgi:N-acetylglutamate synthase-like GNAT family acetyltransferase
MLIFKRPSEMEFRQVKRLIGKFDLNLDDASLQQFTILKNNDKLLAFGCIRKTETYAELDCVGVVEEQRGKGWGKMIVNKLLETGPPTIWLTTDTPKYFEKFNFVTSKQLPKDLARRVEQVNTGRKTRLKGMVYSKKK